MKKQPRILGSIAKPLALRHRRLWSAGLLLSSSLLLGACGQRGPLYLPSPAQSASSPSAPSPAKATTP
ncbi:MAG: hypothetical protein EOP38_17065 [Rubrivivax sp.]|nr:MAG: hypothetical protein EOP38_17065 [Rubrivivax sp.]